MSDDILIAEIPKNRSEGYQANFPAAIIEGFFEIPAEVGLHQELVFCNVAESGALRSTEHRPFVTVGSQNYRFELGAGTGLAYPKGPDRPIGVFWRKGGGEFWYILLLPQSKHYENINGVLQVRYTGPARQLSRVTMTAEQLKEFWPDSPFWK